MVKYWRVLELCQAMPGGVVKDENGQSVKLAEKFGEHDTLITCLWMDRPHRKRPSPMCATLLGAMDIP